MARPTLQARRAWDESRVRRDRRGRFADKDARWLGAASSQVASARQARFDPRAGVSDAKAMMRRRKDAMKPPPFRVPTRREARLAEFERDLADLKKQLAKGRRGYNKAIREARAKYGEPDEGSKKALRTYWMATPESAIRNKQQLIDKVKNSDGPWDEPEPYVDPIQVGELDPKRPLAIYGDLLKIGGGAPVERHARDLEQIPVQLHAIVAADMLRHRNLMRNNEWDRDANEVGVWLSSQPADMIGGDRSLVGQQPSGWAAGKTWRDVDGAYQHHKRRLLAGHTANAEAKGESAAQHEFGHALDAAIGDRMSRNTLGGKHYDWYSETPAWRKLYKRVVKADREQPLKMNPYFTREDGGRGPREMFAEAFAQWARGMATPADQDTDMIRYRGLRREGHAKERLFAHMGVPAVAADEMHQHFMKLSQELGVQW